MSNALPLAKKLKLAKSVEFSDFGHTSKNHEREPDEVLKKRLGKKAKLFLQNAQKHQQYRCFQYQEEDMSSNVIFRIASKMKVPIYAEKLFEGAYIDGISQSVADYVFGKQIGYDEYFNCPTIIIRDTKDEVVDLVKYRPSRDGYENLPKYLQEKSINKPEGRGKNFMYPFQIEMERLIKKEGFVFLGEGLKNAVNALIRSVPYISIESTSNIKNDNFVAYVNKLFRDGVVVYGAMDGDTAGEKAFNTINDKLIFSIENLLDFESGLDFTDYLRKEQL